jgi:hypothetical protein
VGDLRSKARRSLICDANSHQCICETLRSVYDLVHGFPESEWKSKITELLIDALMMGKKMDARLVYYQGTYGDDTGNKASDLKFIDGNSKTRKMRQKRAIK